MINNHLSFIINRLIASVALLISAQPMMSQTTSNSERKVHLSVSATAGTTGIGGEIAVQPTEWLNVRAGGTYMPHINVPRKLTLQVGDHIDKWADKHDQHGNVIPSRFDRMSDFLYDITGYRTDEYVRINRRPVMNNGHVVLDFSPIRSNRNWHISAGLYVGSRHFITGENDLRESPVLVGVNVYNNIYQKVIDGQPIMMGSKELPIPASIQQMIRDYGRMTVNVGTFRHDILDEQGNVLHQAGDKFYLEPDANSLIAVDCRVRPVRPYVGIGYMGALSKRSDHWKIGFDAGMLIWGGHPTITMTRTEHFTTTDPKSGKATTINQYYDIDVTRDIDFSQNFELTYKRILKEVNFMKALWAYPVLELKLSYRIF